MEKYTEKKISTFKERFSELCESNPMNDTALGNALHVSKQTISAWKSGTRSPRQPIIIDIANYFRVSVAWLMGFDVKKELTPREMIEEGFKNIYNKYGLSYPPDESPQTPEARILAKGIDKMPQAQREAIMNLMIGLYPGIFEKENHTDDT